MWFYESHMWVWAKWGVSLSPNCLYPKSHKNHQVRLAQWSFDSAHLRTSANGFYVGARIGKPTHIRTNSTNGCQPEPSTSKSNRWETEGVLSFRAFATHPSGPLLQTAGKKLGAGAALVVRSWSIMAKEGQRSLYKTPKWFLKLATAISFYIVISRELLHTQQRIVDFWLATGYCIPSFVAKKRLSTYRSKVLAGLSGKNGDGNSTSYFLMLVSRVCQSQSTSTAKNIQTWANATVSHRIQALRLQPPSTSQPFRNGTISFHPNKFSTCSNQLPHHVQ